MKAEAPSSTFKRKFICEEKVDSIDVQNFHSMLKKILMEKEVIPKILALKYILTYFDGQTHKKAEYKSAYSVFCAAVLFTVFANKKESDTFYNFVRLEDWKSRIDKWLYDYITSHELTRGKVLASYKYSEGDDDSIQEIRCKSLAAISNFFMVTKSGSDFITNISNALELNQFFNDKTTYSLEHFIIAKSGNLHVKTEKYDFPYKYHQQFKSIKTLCLIIFLFPKHLTENFQMKISFQRLQQLKNI